MVQVKSDVGPITSLMLLKCHSQGGVGRALDRAEIEIIEENIISCNSVGNGVGRGSRGSFPISKTYTIFLHF